MDEREEMIKRIRAGNFVENTGRVLRLINVTYEKYNRLTGIKYALPNIDERDFIKAVNFLYEAGYIHLRIIETKVPAADGLADIDYKQLEAKLTAKGIQLLAFSINDPLVKV